jgi:hypothetical protein
MALRFEFLELAEETLEQDDATFRFPRRSAEAKRAVNAER